MSVRSPLSVGGVDIRSIVQSIFGLFRGKAQQVCFSPCDGHVLRLHYRWAFCFMFGSFLTVWYSWYQHEIINCILSYNGDSKTRPDYQNICLSYPFKPTSNGRRYFLFYRWIHWTFLILSALYLIPRKLSKSFDNPKIKKLMEDLMTLSPRYDKAENEILQRASHYMIVNLRTHNGMYLKYILVHMVALLIDLFTFWFLDFILHNRFINLVPKSYPFTRDPVNFTDYISDTFPPFLTCELNEQHKILYGRTEVIGCHLTIMELYEKIFFILWIFLLTLVICSVVYIIFLGSMFQPTARRFFLRTAKPTYASANVNVVIDNVISHTKVGDTYVLYRLKHLMSHARFYELLTRLCPADDKNINTNSTTLGNSVLSEKSDKDQIHNLYPSFNAENSGCSKEERKPYDSQEIPSRLQSLNQPAQAGNMVYNRRSGHPVTLPQQKLLQASQATYLQQILQDPNAINRIRHANNTKKETSILVDNYV